MTISKLNLTSASLRSGIVSPWDFPMECVFEYYPGDPLGNAPLFGGPTPIPSSAQLMSCKVNGRDIMDMLSTAQIERIEDALVDQLEQA
jgi:hypothetical protein